MATCLAFTEGRLHKAQCPLFLVQQRRTEETSNEDSVAEDNAHKYHPSLPRATPRGYDE